MSVKVQIVPALNDNYIYLIIADDGQHVGVVDPGDGAATLKALEHANLTPTHIFNTHHHSDHTAGNQALKERFQAPVIGPADEAQRIPDMDQSVREGDVLDFGGSRVEIIATPGHTKGHIAFHFPDDAIAFVGDTLFVMGCGRLFEGDAAQMWHSLSKLRALPPETRIYCGHEYTLSNARFARSIDPDNAALGERLRIVEGQRSRGLATIPTTIAEECATNPFLRADDADLQANLGMSGAPATEVFAEIRRRKDAV